MKVEREKTYLFRNDLDSLTDVRTEVRLFLGNDCSDHAKGRIVFCIDEAVANVIEHGFLDGESSQIELILQYIPGQWIFTIIDEGIPFDPTKKKSDSWDALYESGADGGFGIPSIKKIMSISYVRTVYPPKNRLTLVYLEESNE